MLARVISPVMRVQIVLAVLGMLSIARAAIVFVAGAQDRETTPRLASRRAAHRRCGR
jgi:hypothetical protein